jgi:hypothetical protein
MSDMALARCRRLRVTEIKDADGQRWLLEVFDPKFPGKAHTTFMARSAIDCARIRRTYTQQYRIPEQLVEVVAAKELVSDTPETQTEAKNASGNNGSASKVHQPRKAVLAFKVIDADIGTAEGSGVVPE